MSRYLQKAHVRRTGTPRRTKALLATVALLGVMIMLYPMTARWYSQSNQSSNITGYSMEVDAISLAERQAALEEAREYNESLPSGSAFDPFTQAIAVEGSAQYEEYLNQLEGVPTGVMARISIPEIDADLPIYHGTSEATLLEGVGHLYGTSLPVGGEGTHSVLTAHSGMADAVLFTYLNDLELGDTFDIEVYGERLTYEINEITVVEPHETETLVPEAGEDLVTLVTCTPIGINSHRLLVTGERIATPEDPQEPVPADVEIPGFPWWAVFAAATFVIALAYVFTGNRTPGRHRAQPSDLPHPPPPPAAHPASAEATSALADARSR